MIFSVKSNERLNTCHKDLQLIFREALKHTFIDFGIAEGHRSILRQRELYEQGLSQIDGFTKRSNHNYTPSMAVDIYAFVNGKANYDQYNLCYLAGVILETAKRLFEEGKVKYELRWGGNWGKWKSGCNHLGFVDMVHFELI